MVDFYPVITDDGTLSLFNTKINDIYHSKIGACTEAFYKFTLPSGVLEYARNNDNIRILDVCYGLGYNSRVTISEILKVNPSCKINVTGIEIDPDVLAYSYFVTFNNENCLSKSAFRHILLTNTQLRRLITDFNKSVNFNSKIKHHLKPFYQKFHKCHQSFYVKPADNRLLHNIYYGTISHRNKYNCKITYSNKNLEIDLYINDLRKQIINLNEPYDFIFHDPFTPSLVPSLWSVELFEELYRLLKHEGTLTTYTSSAAVRSGMIEAGFFVGRTTPVGRKSSGTIAYKNNKLIRTPPDKVEKGLLETNAGIPYYDPGFKFTDEQIIINREELLKKSGRMSTSQYLKSV